ncbi:hypothetical protein G7Y89_g5794 [Cudoniella acicularis]|uniref:NAD(P)-binding protein n=1 Tax=Cudoniella acicularis TaxID=354080 RepID=A0A8H4RP04_9HELO|nr:hypothetical protein G7Y89_g5794 [Cudoniella acicularis]
MSFFQLLKNQWTPLPYPEASFDGKTIIVTGANIGLGLEAARHFTRLGAAKVILACRSIAKGEAAVHSIEESTGRKGVCEVWQVDLGNYDSVKEFCSRAAGLQRLDVVCENAGVASGTYSQSEGTENTIAVNVIGTFLMALNLLPVLRRSGKKFGVLPRLAITSSEVHQWAKFVERHEESIFEALKKNDPERMKDRYQVSKLLEVFFVRSLAAKMQEGTHSNEPVVLNCFTPGLCHSALGRSVTGIAGLIFYFMKLLLAKSTEMGSRTIVKAAEMGEESHGKYMNLCAIGEPSEFVRSEEGKKTQERVWDELIEILEKIQPGISKNI